MLDLQPEPVLNEPLTAPPWLSPRFRALPGIQPLGEDNWIWVLENYAAQMAERERLLSRVPHLVHGLLPEAEEAADELYALVLDDLTGRSGFIRDGNDMSCPDGRLVHLDRDRPLMTLGRLLQEDLCIMQKPSGMDEHVLTGAILCFPSAWTLAEKLGHPLIRIHKPVPAYDPDIARRVQRLFDGIQTGRPLWRANAHFHDDPTLFAPCPEAAKDAHKPAASRARYLRSERQVLQRLPQTGAVVFSIHTLMFRGADLTDRDMASLTDA